MKISKYCAILLTSVAVYTGSAHAQVTQLDRVAAIVDNEVIMKSQLERRVNEVVKSITTRGGEVPPRDTLIKQVLDRLVIEDLQLQLAEQYGIRVEDEELSLAVADVAKRNNLSLDKFTAALKAEGLSLDSVREQIRREIVISRVRQRIVGDRIRITDQEVKNFLSSEVGKVHLSEEYYLASILVPVPQGSTYDAMRKAQSKAVAIYKQLQDGADFTRLAISNSSGDTALEGGEIGWRQAAQLPPPFDQLVEGFKVGDFTEPVSTPGGFIILKVTDKRGGTSSMRDEISVRHILLKPTQIRSEDESQKLAQRLYDRLKTGEKFADLAKKFSDDPGSAAHGGDLNWIDPRGLVPEFQKVMNETPVGEISQPFKSQYGWHVLQVEGRRSTDNSEEYQKQQAMNILYGRKYEQELQIWLQQIRDEAYVEVRN